MGALTRGIGSLLAGFYAVVPNYGVSILLLTGVVSLAVLPFMLARVRSTTALQALQPHLRRTRELYKSDPERLRVEYQKLYAEHGVHPAAGCLPSLVQIPVWIALYRVLRDAVGIVPADSVLHHDLAVGRSGFLGLDLMMSAAKAASDGVWSVAPYAGLVAVLVAVGFVLQRLSRSETSGGLSTPSAARSLSAVVAWMPAVMGAVAWRVPSGLVLYWLASQSIRGGLQLYVARAAGASSAGSQGRPDTRRAESLEKEQQDGESDGSNT